MFNKYTTAINNFQAVKLQVANKLYSVFPLIPSFVTLADKFYYIFAPIRSVYNVVLYTARVVIETNVNQTLSLGDLAYRFFIDYTNQNLTLGSSFFNAGINEVTTILSNALNVGNPKALSCTYTFGPQIVFLIKDTFAAISNCIDTTANTLNFTSVHANLDSAIATIKGKYQEFAACTVNVTSTSPTTVLDKAKLCVAVALNGVPFTSTKASIATLNAGAILYDLLLLQQYPVFYTCLIGARNTAIAQTAALKANVQKCLI